MVISVRMLALRHFVCTQMFYLKRAQSQKQNVKNKSTIVSSPKVKEYHVLCQENACEFLFLQSLASSSQYTKRIRVNTCKLLITFSKIFRYSW